jgi:phosphoribosylglycinamide formyltransferase-1
MVSCFKQQTNPLKQIVIFASGSGTNAQKIIEYFSNSDLARVVKIFSNRSDAYVLQRACRMNIPAVVFNKADFYENDLIFHQLFDLQPDLIVLAGFLWKVPEKIVHAFPKRIINIHPALLPKYGGKGMYGDHVHRSVIENREKESGVTIHYVNENYDEGAFIFQAQCGIDVNDTPETLAKKVHALEYEYYAKTIEMVLLRV